MTIYVKTCPKCGRDIERCTDGLGVTIYERRCSCQVRRMFFETIICIAAVAFACWLAGGK